MSVLLDKFLIRSFLASVYPVSAYSLGFLLYKLIGNVPIAFFNNNACIVLASLCLFWPLQNIGLWIFSDRSRHSLSVRWGAGSRSRCIERLLRRQGRRRDSSRGRATKWLRACFLSRWKEIISRLIRRSSLRFRGLPMGRSRPISMELIWEMAQTPSTSATPIGTTGSLATACCMPSA